MEEINGTSRSTAAQVLATLEALSGSGEGITAGEPGLTVAELARRLGRDKSTVSRQLRPLVELGLVERDEDGHHRLGWRLFTLAARAGDQRLLLLAAPVMRRLADLTRERVHLNILRGEDVLTILSESSGRSVEAVGWVGRTTPPHTTSAGRALLLDHSDDDLRRFAIDLRFIGHENGAPRDVEDLVSRVRESRTRGFALAEGEFDPDLVGCAAPVRDFSGRIVAALNVSAPTYRLQSRLPWMGRQVAAAAAHLSRVVSVPEARPSGQRTTPTRVRPHERKP